MILDTLLIILLENLKVEAMDIIFMLSKKHKNTSTIIMQLPIQFASKSKP